jgi:DNA-binding CsgD family transcriptional regulator
MVTPRKPRVAGPLAAYLAGRHVRGADGAPKGAVGYNPGASQPPPSRFSFSALALAGSTPGAPVRGRRPGTRSHDELVAAGARPRRDPIESRSSLTASELRVARLAAEGLTNREIAQELFLTEKTIEVHQTRVYRKLEISSRSQLGRKLPATAAPA